MTARVGFVVLVLAALLAAGRLWSGSHYRSAVPCQKAEEASVPENPTEESPTLPKTDEQWRKVLTPEQFHVTRQKGTEAPYSGEYYKTDKEGVYRCLCCGEPLFSSDTKFDAHCGWPSFWKPLEEGHIKALDDFSHGMQRTEVQCRKCGAHLGHVFDDGPQPTGQRYCINSLSLKLEEKKAAGAKPEGGK
jgi:peptide-methionine (R)-S-oxide reductase